MPRLGLEDIPKAGLIRSDQFLMFAILFMACMVSSWATTRPADSLVDDGERRVRTRTTWLSFVCGRRKRRAD